MASCLTPQVQGGPGGELWMGLGERHLGVGSRVDPLVSWKRGKLGWGAEG